MTGADQHIPNTTGRRTYDEIIRNPYKNQSSMLYPDKQPEEKIKLSFLV